VSERQPITGRPTERSQLFKKRETCALSASERLIRRMSEQRKSPKATETMMAQTIKKKNYKSKTPNSICRSDRTRRKRRQKPSPRNEQSLSSVPYLSLIRVFMVCHENVSAVLQLCPRGANLFALLIICVKSSAQEPSDRTAARGNAIVQFLESREMILRANHRVLQPIMPSGASFKRNFF